MTTRTARTLTPDYYETFVEGQTCRLIVGGPLGVILEVCDDCGDVSFAYATSDGDIDVLTVPPSAIVLADG